MSKKIAQPLPLPQKRKGPFLMDVDSIISLYLVSFICMPGLVYIHIIKGIY